jgi:catechol 2,3-dioxygenase-like lactoylglutathione lyase family enzyme
MKFNKLIPELTVSDIDKSLKFYVDILGFKKEYAREESKFVFLSFQGSQLMLQEKGQGENWETGKLQQPFGRGINFQIESKNIDVLFKALKKNNHPVKIMPKENWYRMENKMLGNKEFLVTDPDGYLLRFAEDLGSKRIKN